MSAIKMSVFKYAMALFVVVAVLPTQGARIDDDYFMGYRGEGGDVNDGSFVNSDVGNSNIENDMNGYGANEGYFQDEENQPKEDEINNKMNVYGEDEGYFQTKQDDQLKEDVINNMNGYGANEGYFREDQPKEDQMNDKNVYTGNGRMKWKDRMDENEGYVQAKEKDQLKEVQINNKNDAKETVSPVRYLQSKQHDEPKEDSASNGNSCNKVCPSNIRELVCGSDNVTYHSECAFKVQRCSTPSIQIVFAGNCSVGEATVEHIEQRRPVRFHEKASDEKKSVQTKRYLKAKQKDHPRYNVKVASMGARGNKMTPVKDERYLQTIQQDHPKYTVNGVVHASCGGWINRAGWIHYPYRGKYANSQRCIWRISVGRPFTLIFTWMDLEKHPSCGYDYVETTGEVKSKSCGKKLPQNILVTSGRLNVIFRSDGSVQGTGFRAMILYTRVLTSCGGTITSPSWIKYPHIGLYPNSVNCHWSIRMNRATKIHYSKFDLEGGSGCPFDYAHRTGDSVRYCGSSLPPDRWSQHGRQTLVFRSDGSVRRSGFEAEVSTALEKWPEGNYGIVSHDSCPPGWYEFTHCQDTEDSNNRDIFGNFKLRLTAPAYRCTGTYLTMRYCFKGAGIPSRPGGFWTRRGSYGAAYVIRNVYAACSQFGADGGHVNIDNEDSNNKNRYGINGLNMRKHNRYYPRGFNFGHNTHLEFCKIGQRKGGVLTDYIEVGEFNNQKFGLFVYPGHGCPKLKSPYGILHGQYQEFFMDDEDDNNANSVGGGPPVKLEGRDSRWAVCAYNPARYLHQ